MKRSERKRRRAERERPALIAGIEASHDRMSDALAQRRDRFSQLLSRAVRDERQGNVLMTASGLTRDEHAELAHLTPAAHEEFRVELAATIAKLRELLTAGDPFYILAIVQDLNLFVPWGEYYEPTHEGLETRLELVAGLLATQPVGSRDRPTAEAVQAILDEIDHALLVNTLFNLTMRPRGNYELASLRFSSAMRWMSIRGSSFAGHGEALARELYESQDPWLTKNLGFTIGDVMRVGQAVSDAACRHSCSHASQRGRHGHDPNARRTGCGRSRRTYT